MNDNDEKIGDPIPGSKLMRDFCCMCGGAMRVTHIEKYRPTCLSCLDACKPQKGRDDPQWRQDFQYHGLGNHG